jgi:signal transduction histidine kinase
MEYKTTQRERSRLATDLHDTLEQALTGVSLQLQAVELFRGNDPDRSATHLRLAQQFLDRSREDMHRTVWDLRAHGLDGRGIVEALRDQLGRMVAGSPIRSTVESVGQNQDLPDFIAVNLLRLAQEAVTNTLNHGAATQVDVCLDFRADGVTLRVTDDGCGFDPAPCARAPRRAFRIAGNARTGQACGQRGSHRQRTEPGHEHRGGGPR